jgi:hypothetical protein
LSPEEEKEKQLVQRNLAELMRKAISMGAEMPEISGFDKDNATLYVKVNVNNTGERIANASDFYFAVNYQTGPGSAGVAAFYGSDAGVIVRLPESTYGLMSQRSETGDPVKDSFINSFGLTSYSGDCYGKIKSGESKECTVIKSISTPSNKTSSNTFAQSPQASEESTLQGQSPDFESSLSELIPADSNFSKSSEFDSPLGLETPELNLPDVNGTYVNSDVGLQVDLPKGWKGKEISFIMDSVIAAPKGINLEAFEEPGTAMAIKMIDEETFNKFASLAQFLGENASQVGGGDPLSMQGVEGQQCKELPASFVTINGIKAEQRTADCTDEGGTVTKTKGYTFATANDTIIVLALFGNSTKEYNQYLPQFEESVKTIKISEPGDIATSEIYKKHKELEMQNNNKTLS